MPEMATATVRKFAQNLLLVLIFLATSQTSLSLSSRPYSWKPYLVDRGHCNMLVRAVGDITGEKVTACTIPLCGSCMN